MFENHSKPCCVVERGDFALRRERPLDLSNLILNLNRSVRQSAVVLVENCRAEQVGTEE